MSDDLIERETLIEASLERVWALVAEPGFWVTDGAGPSGAAVGEGGSVTAGSAGGGGFPVRVERVDPPTYVAYRRVAAPGEESRGDGGTLVEFTLTAEGDKTRLRVVESGFAVAGTRAEARPGRAALREP